MASQKNGPLIYDWVIVTLVDNEISDDEMIAWQSDALKFWTLTPVTEYGNTFVAVPVMESEQPATGGKFPYLKLTLDIFKNPVRLQVKVKEPPT